MKYVSVLLYALDVGWLSGIFTRAAGAGIVQKKSHEVERITSGIHLLANLPLCLRSMYWRPQDLHQEPERCKRVEKFEWLRSCGKSTTC